MCTSWEETWSLRDLIISEPKDKFLHHSAALEEIHYFVPEPFDAVSVSSCLSHVPCVQVDSESESPTKNPDKVWVISLWLQSASKEEEPSILTSTLPASATRPISLVHHESLVGRHILTDEVRNNQMSLLAAVRDHCYRCPNKWHLFPEGTSEQHGCVCIICSEDMYSHKTKQDIFKPITWLFNTFGQFTVFIIEFC